MSDVAFFKQRQQPGCTDDEQRRFAELLRRGELVDSYRQLHAPDADAASALSLPLPPPPPSRVQDLRSHTWRGNDRGMYARKTMRIDHFILSRRLLPRLLSCKNADPNLWSSFLGSDHLPVVLCLRDARAIDGTPTEARGLS